MPKQLIIDTGLDALSHVIEALFSTLCSDIVEVISLRSIRIIADHLTRAANYEKSSLEQMAYAAMLGGIAIAHASTILPHIMGYLLTTHYGIPHGRAGMLMIPQYLEYLRKSCLETAKLNQIDAIFEPLNGIEGLFRSLNLQTKLSIYGITKNDLPEFVEKVITKDDIKITPGNIDQKTILELYISAL